MHEETATSRSEIEPLWGVEEVAVYLGVGKRWVRDHIHEIPGYCALPGSRVNNKHRFVPAKLRAWAQRGGDHR